MLFRSYLRYLIDRFGGDYNKALAGYNAVQYSKNKPLLELPRELVTGDIIAYANDKIRDGKMRRRRLRVCAYYTVQSLEMWRS